MTETLKAGLEQAGMSPTSSGPAPLWNLPEDAAAAKGISYDLAAIRILVKTNEECYRALAVVHDAFRPIPGRFKDYIGFPSLTAISPCIPLCLASVGVPRSADPHTGNASCRRVWNCSSLEIQGNRGSNHPVNRAMISLPGYGSYWNGKMTSKDAQEYLESIKDNLFEDDVYVFTL